MHYMNATLADIDAIYALQTRYHVDSISEEDKKDGFVTTLFTKDLLKALIEEEDGIAIAKDQGKLVGYAMAASWHYWSKWPLFQKMIEDLPKLVFLGQPCSLENSYQYGPICIDKPYRGTEVLPMLFEQSRKTMQKRFPILLTFVNQNNPRSIKAHGEKLGLTEIQRFDFNKNHYIEYALDTSQSVLKD